MSSLKSFIVLWLLRQNPHPDPLPGYREREIEPRMPVVELLSDSKHFGDVAALADVSLSISPGRVVGLLGENGEGKSTLMNVLYGLVRSDAGEIRIDGLPVTIRSPKDAIALGVGMVHQHFMLAGGMNVLDNVLLGDRREGQWLGRRR